MTFAIITGRASPGDIRPETWTIVSGFKTTDEAIVYARMAGEVVPNSTDPLKKSGPLVLEITDYEQELVASGRLGQFQKYLADYNEAQKADEKARVERQRKLASIKAEQKRKAEVERRQQEIMDQRLRDELESARRQAETEVANATAK